MRKKLMTGIALMALPAMFVSTASYGADEGADVASDQTVVAVPPAPQGPFFSRGMASDPGGFPPMGFDPMNPSAADGQIVQNRPPVPAYPGNTMNNAMGAGQGGGTDVDIEVRGRIGLSGSGAGRGNQGWGANNFMRNMPYGMPYRHGYGAPYGTPFNPGYGAPQAAPAAPQAPAPEVSAAPHGPGGSGGSNPPAPEPTPTPTPTPSSAQAQPQPFTWAPQQGVRGGNLNPQPPAQAAAPALTQPQAQPQQPAEPDWVKQQRVEAEKRREEAQKRYQEVQQNNPYARQGGYPQQGFARGFGQPFNHSYGAPYGVPFSAQPYGYAPQAQPQAPVTSGQGN
ncbi:MAG: hypothetical protein OQK24_09610 [Magnetovibrio sp.]|nr:hypothetical protein [Magnetovibrio sp.]